MRSMRGTDITEVGPVVPSYRFPSLQQINFYFWVDVFRVLYHFLEAPREKQGTPVDFRKLWITIEICCTQTPTPSCSDRSKNQNKKDHIDLFSGSLSSPHQSLLSAAFCTRHTISSPMKTSQGSQQMPFSTNSHLFIGPCSRIAFCFNPDQSNRFVGHSRPLKCKLELFHLGEKKEMSHCTFSPCKEHKKSIILSQQMSKFLLHLSRMCLYKEGDNAQL